MCPILFETDGQVQRHAFLATGAAANEGVRDKDSHRRTLWRYIARTPRSLTSSLIGLEPVNFPTNRAPAKRSIVNTRTGTPEASRALRAPEELIRPALVASTTAG